MPIISPVLIVVALLFVIAGRSGAEVQNTLQLTQAQQPSRFKELYFTAG